VFKKYRLYKAYKKFIRDKEAILESKFRLRRDYTNFLYTVVNLDPDTVNKYYAENENVAKPAINEYIKSVDSFFRKFGMQEFVAIRKIKRLDDFNWKVEFGFSLFNSKKRANRMIIFSLLTIILAILALIIF